MCLFDLDYTRVRLTSDPIQVYTEVLTQYGFQIESTRLRSAYRSSWNRYLTDGFKHSTERAAYREGTRHTLSLLNIRDIDSLVLEEITKRLEISSSVELYDDSIPVLKELRLSGLRTGIATGRWHDPSITIKSVGLTPYVDVTYHSGTLGIQKNDVKFWSLILEHERLGVDAVMLVDDNVEAVATAKEIGIRALRIERQDSPIRSPELANLSRLNGLPSLLETNQQRH